MKIVADDKIPFLKGILEPYAQVTYLPGAAISADDVRDADALIIRTRTKCNAKLLDGANVKFIASATIGCDHMDFNYCRAHSIRAVTAPGCNAKSVAQYIASILVRDAEKNNTSLKGRTLGIIGAGHVGTQVAELAAKLEMHVLLNDPPRARIEGDEAFTDIKTIQKEADFISLHTPLSTEGQDRTFHLANEDFFLPLARKPLFINAARGEVADSSALKGAIITHRIRAAAIDVWEDEPDINEELLNLAAYATPHIAGYSADGKANGTAAAVRDLAEFFGIDALKDYFPQDIPAPDKNELLLPYEKTAVYDAILATYDVLEDDARLRRDPESFERLRGDYPLRREFNAYNIAPDSRITPSTRAFLGKLGFKIQ